MKHGDPPDYPCDGSTKRQQARGMALGATYHLSVDDRTSYAEDYLRARITCALGGCAAEKLVYGVATTGAENDLQQVTEIARHMRHG
jgi:cell division protease FtsH